MIDTAKLPEKLSKAYSSFVEKTTLGRYCQEKGVLNNLSLEIGKEADDGTATIDNNDKIIISEKNFPNIPETYLTGAIAHEVMHSKALAKATGFKKDKNSIEEETIAKYIGETAAFEATKPKDFQALNNLKPTDTSDEARRLLDINEKHQRRALDSGRIRNMEAPGKFLNPKDSVIDMAKAVYQKFTPIVAGVERLVKAVKNGFQFDDTPVN